MPHEIKGKTGGAEGSFLDGRVEFKGILYATHSSRLILLYISQFMEKEALSKRESFSRHM